jgi:putative heme degradation protein
MVSCLLAGSQRAEQILLRSIYIPWTFSSNGNIISFHRDARALRQNITRPGGPREISTSASRKDYHFDTHQFVARLEREGLTRAQAEGVMSSMAEVIDESIRTMTRNMVTKSEQEKVGNILCPVVACHTGLYRREMNES